MKLENTRDIDRLKYCLQTGGVAVAHSGGDDDTSNRDPSFYLFWRK